MQMINSLYELRTLKLNVQNCLHSLPKSCRQEARFQHTSKSFQIKKENIQITKHIFIWIKTSFIEMI
jgi:hypothetical protein